MLALGIRYLTGYAVATEVSSREHAEWPPHPARVFMAMAAAMFESGEDAEGRAVLEWLEQQGSPALRASDAEPRDVVTHYVPVNDMNVPKNAEGLKPKSVREGMGIIPQYRTNRQPRTFPRVRPSDDTVFLVWPGADPDEEQREALEELCAKVTRVGHSSSLVQMWVELEPPECNLEPAEVGDMPLRVVSEGTLDYLANAFNRDEIEAYAELSIRVEAAQGTNKRQLREERSERFGKHKPVSLRPTISQWQAYRRVDTESEASPVVSGVFDRELSVLTLQEGPVIALESTWQLLTALHKTILAACDPTPEWLSGHTEDGAPSQHPHVALVPLAFVGREHADGHLMGIALALPQGIAPRERGQALRGLLYDKDGAPSTVQLKAGALGTWTLTRETRPSPALTLQSRTWTGPSSVWATVTPIVLDRHPKSERSRDREQWSLEVAEIIAESCERQGLPRPIGIDVDKTSWHRGAPRAVAGKSAGYPLMPVKPGQHKRQQVHAWLEFEQPVEGPLLLGTGRYRGYGVCRPWRGGS